MITINSDGTVTGGPLKSPGNIIQVPSGFVNVTDTSQVKIKFYPMSLQSGSYFEGNDTGIIQSSLTFTRMSR